MTLAASSASWNRRAASCCDNTDQSAPSVSWRCGATISGVGENSLDITGNHIDFEVHADSGDEVAKSRRRPRVWDHVDLESCPAHLVDGEAYAVDRDRALAREKTGKFRGCLDDEPGAAAQVLERGHLAHAVDVAAHEVAAETIGEPQRLLEVHVAPALQSRGHREGRLRRVDFERAGALGDHGVAHALDRDRISGRHVGKVESWRLDSQANPVALWRGARDAAHRSDDAGEHLASHPCRDADVLADRANLDDPGTQRL